MPYPYHVTCTIHPQPGIGTAEVQTARITNTFPAAALTVTKHVVNGGTGPYDFTLTCTTGQGEVALDAGAGPGKPGGDLPFTGVGWMILTGRAGSIAEHW